jgi:putative membrane protein
LHLHYDGKPRLKEEQMRRIVILPIALAAGLAVGCDRTDRRDTTTGAVGTSGAVDQVSSADRDFVKDLSIANVTEIEIGKLAAERAASPQVKKFAQMMIDDHTKARDALNALASKHHIMTTALPDAKHRDLKDKLAALKGADFDREYMDTMVDGHKDVADKLESRIDKEKLADWKTQMKDALTAKKEPASAVTVTPERSDNPVTMDLNQWAADTYPTVAKHLDNATTLSDTIKKRRSTN